MWKRCLALIFAGLLSTPSAYAEGASQQREFIMSVTYGVLAGTLVGAASLAFVSKPGDNLNRVARGASIGLYTGILLGLYVVYVVPGMQGPEEEDPQVRLDKLNFFVAPTFTAANQIDGVHADWTILRF